jgi:hypothetical protein
MFCALTKVKCIQEQKKNTKKLFEIVTEWMKIQILKRTNMNWTCFYDFPQNTRQWFFRYNTKMRKRLNLCGKFENLVAIHEQIVAVESSFDEKGSSRKRHQIKVNLIIHETMCGIKGVVGLIHEHDGRDGSWWPWVERDSENGIKLFDTKHSTQLKCNRSGSERICEFWGLTNFVL